MSDRASGSAGDLKQWQLSPSNPVLRAEGTDEGVNASDPELIELDGRTHLYFAVGDQLTWMNIKRAEYEGDLQSFLEAWFTTDPPIQPAGATAPGRARR